MKIRFLKDLTRIERLSFIFLSEIISSYVKMEELCRKLKYEGFLAIEPVGRSGGIATLWKNADYVKLSSMSRAHINVIFTLTDGHTWHLTGVFGEPMRSQRHKTWELLRNLSRDANLPWCLVGDFNNVTSQAYKKGGAVYPRI